MVRTRAGQRERMRPQTFRALKEEDAHEEENHVAFTHAVPQAADELRHGEACKALADALVDVAPQEDTRVDIPELWQQRNAAACLHLQPLPPASRGPVASIQQPRIPMQR